MTDNNPITLASQLSSIDLPELNLRITEEGWTEAALVRDSKPPSLKEQALKAATEMADCMKAGFVPKRSDLDIIRRALESLPD